MARIANFSIETPSGGLPVNTPIACTAICDGDPEPIYSGAMSEDGRFALRLANCAPGGGLNVVFQAKGYQPRVFRMNVPDIGQSEAPHEADGIVINPLRLEPSTPPFPVFSTEQLRRWNGNMCGIRVPGLPPVDGGAADASLVLSWFIDRYSYVDRKLIRLAMSDRGLTHTLLSLPDALAQNDMAHFVTVIQEQQNILGPVCVMLTSKDYIPYGYKDPRNVPVLIAQLRSQLPVLLAAGVQSFCVGWELDLWLEPDQLEPLLAFIASVVVPRAILYVHFSQAVFAWQPDGHDTAYFWNHHVGQLTGILYQKDLSWDDAMWQARIQDGLSRFAGGFNFVTDSGFGHPFDYVTLEVTAAQQFAGDMSEAEGDRIGKVGMDTPPCTGPTGVTVGVMGYGNGCA